MSEKSGGPEQELRWGEVCFKQRGGDADPKAVTWPVPLGAGGGGRLVAWEPPPAGGAAQPAPAFRFNAGAGVRASVRPMPVQTPQAARVEWSAGGVA